MRRSSLWLGGVYVDIESRPHSQQVQASVVVRAGPRYEPKGQAGITHFMEHMLFHGTTTRTQKQFHELLASRGISVNADTGRDFTRLQFTCPRSELLTALTLQADMLLRPAFPASAVLSERSVVGLEVAGGIHDTDELIRQYQWPGRLGRPVAGTPSQVKRYRHAALVAWHRQVVRQGNVGLFLTGGLPTHQLYGWILGLYRELRRTPDVTVPNVEPDARSPCFLLDQFRSTGATDMRVTWSVPVADVWDYEDLLEVLTGSHSSPLRRGLVETRGLAYELTSNLEVVAGKSAVDIIIEPSDPDETLSAMFDILRDWAPDEQDVIRAVAAFKGNQAEKADHINVSEEARVDLWLNPCPPRPVPTVARLIAARNFLLATKPFITVTGETSITVARKMARRMNLKLRCRGSL